VPALPESQPSVKGRTEFLKNFDVEVEAYDMFRVELFGILQDLLVLPGFCWDGLSATDALIFSSASCWTFLLEIRSWMSSSNGISDPRSLLFFLFFAEAITSAIGLQKGHGTPESLKIHCYIFTTSTIPAITKSLRKTGRTEKDK
jgi:hypothetical protein